MGKINDIIKSGHAPGLRIGSPAVSEQTVYHKAPKALKEIERGERGAKAPISARDISRLFGMSVDTIKGAWGLSCLLGLLMLNAVASGGDITGGVSYQNGQLLTGPLLNQGFSGAIINTTFYSSKPVDPAVLSSDTVLVFSPTLAGFYKATVSALFLNNPAVITSQAPYTTPATNDLLLIYSVGSASLFQITVSNLLQNAGLNQPIIGKFTTNFIASGINAGDPATNFVHGLKGTPQLNNWVLLDVTANAGYTFGDEIPVQNLIAQGFTNSPYFYGANLTNVWIGRIGNGQVAAYSKTNGNILVLLTLGDWQLKNNAEYFP